MNNNHRTDFGSPFRLRPFSAALLVGAILLPIATPVWAFETIRYVDKDGVLRTAELDTVTKSNGTEFRGYIRVGGRRKSLKIDARQIVELRRGDSASINQWSKRLAHGLRLMSAGQIGNRGTASGAEETFSKIAFSVERGTKGQEATERCNSWQNMYAHFYLIEARLNLGAANEAKYVQALEAIAQFRQRTAARSTAKIDMSIPDYKGGVRGARVFGWGANRLSPYVDLLEARAFAGLKQNDKALAAYDKLISEAVKSSAAPQLIVDAVMGKTVLVASGQEAEKQETVYRSAGTQLRAAAARQPDAFGRKSLTHAANLAMLTGADLLFDAAISGKYGVAVALNRYKALRDSAEGRSDSSLRIGAETGVGMCLVEEGGKGEEAYNALLNVVVSGFEHPEQVNRALYYLSRASPQYADVVEKAGGSGDFLRAEGARWKNDLLQRFPNSKWAKKAQSE